jgi:hypothetical protein
MKKYPLAAIILLLMVLRANGQSDPEEKKKLLRFADGYARCWVKLEMQENLPSSQFAGLFAAGVILQNDFSRRDSAWLTPMQYYDRIKAALVNNPSVHVVKVDTYTSEDFLYAKDRWGVDHIWLYRTLVYRWGRGRQLRRYSSWQQLDITGEGGDLKIVHLVNTTARPPDQDKDKVPDILDQCKGTAPGMTVNLYGCPLDWPVASVPASPVPPAPLARPARVADPSRVAHPAHPASVTNPSSVADPARQPAAGAGEPAATVTTPTTRSDDGSAHESIDTPPGWPNTGQTTPAYTARRDGDNRAQQNDDNKLPEDFWKEEDRHVPYRFGVQLDAGVPYNANATLRQQLGFTAGLSAHWYPAGWFSVSGSYAYLHLPLETAGLNTQIQAQLGNHVTSLSVRSDAYHLHLAYGGLGVGSYHDSRLLFSIELLGGRLYADEGFPNRLTVDVDGATADAALFSKPVWVGGGKTSLGIGLDSKGKIKLLLTALYLQGLSANAPVILNFSSPVAPVVLPPVTVQPAPVRAWMGMLGVQVSI